MAKRFVRCIEGHIYDADAHSQCPTCGNRAQVEAPPAEADAPPAEAEAPPTTDDAAPTTTALSAIKWQTYKVPGAAAGVIAVVALLWVAFHGERKPDKPPPPANETHDVRPKKEPDKKEQDKKEQDKKDRADNDAKKDTPKKDTPRKDEPKKDEQPKDSAEKDSKSKPDTNATIVREREAANDCDKLAASPDDPDRIAGVDGVRELGQIKPTAAIAACEQASKRAPAERRFFTQLGRAYRAADRNSDAAIAYRTAADKGSAFAANGLGQLYRDGSGIAQSFAEAHRYLRQSADAGLPVGMITYANLLYDSRATDKPDYAEARRWVERAAKANYPDAINLFGYFLEQGWGGPKDMDGAVRNYEKAAQLGVAQSFFFLGQIAEEGRNGSKDLAAARKYYQTAAAGGDLNGLRKVALLTLDSQTATPVQVEDARQMLMKGASAGHLLAMWSLANYTDKGRFGREDPQLARQWWEKAAELGDTSSMVSLGFLYRVGRGVPRNYGEARRWYVLAADKGSSAAVASLGVLYEYGLGVPQNYNEAWRLYDKAASAGNTFAMVYLGGMIEAGKGLKQDNNEAWRWYIKAWQAGDVDGQWRTASMADRFGNNRNVPEIAKNMLEALRGGSSEAKTALFENANRTIRRDTRAAIERILSDRGFYDGSASGRSGRGIHEALQAYMRSSD